MAGKHTWDPITLTVRDDVTGAVGNSLAQQLQKQMLSNIREEFLLKTIDPPIIPEVRVSPNRVFICIIGVFFGFILSVFSVLVYSLVIKNFNKQNLTRSS